MPTRKKLLNSIKTPACTETLVFGVEEMGSGSVAYMVDNPLFRAFGENGLWKRGVYRVGIAGDNQIPNLLHDDIPANIIGENIVLSRIIESIIQRTRLYHHSPTCAAP